jgi:hypothetical protein
MKSATSYLQGLCEQNREQLAAAGIYWCPEDLRYQAVKDVLGKPRRTPNAAKGWDRVVEDLRGHPGDALLSNELLAGLGIRQVRRLVGALPEAEVRVVITARDLARIIPSHWQTTIKNGRTWTWREFAAAVCADGPAETTAPADGREDGEEASAADGAAVGRTASDTNDWFWRKHDLPSIVARWAQVVPVERISLVTVPPDSSDVERVAARFGSVVGIDVAGLEQPDTRRNPTLGAQSVELLRRLNASMAETELDDPDHRFERALGGALAAHAHLEPRFGLTPGQQDWVRQRAQAMVEQVGLLGLEVVGDLADLVPAASPAPDSVDPGDTTDPELLAAAARGLVGLAPVFNELRMERNELRRSIAAMEENVEQLTSRVERQQEGVQALLVQQPVEETSSRSLAQRVRSRLGRRRRVSSG